MYNFQLISYKKTYIPFNGELDMQKHLILAFLAALLVTGCGKKEAQKTEYLESAPKIVTSTEALQIAVNGEHRSVENKARDKYRHPAEIIEFFGIKPESTVVEIWPGGGWYSEILAPYLKDKGTFYAASFGVVPGTEYRTNYHNNLIKKFKDAPDVYGKPIVTVLNPPSQTLIAPSNSADFVLTFRNVHNWTMNGQDTAVFAAAYQALKSGGVFGVVEHRAATEMDAAELAKTGYVSEAYVIQLAQNIGFKLVGRSNINSNPNDTKDYEKGVWTLPPSLRLKDVDRDKYLAIGESDRMTLKFVKP